MAIFRGPDSFVHKHPVFSGIAGTLGALAIGSSSYWGPTKDSGLAAVQKTVQVAPPSADFVSNSVKGLAEGADKKLGEIRAGSGATDGTTSQTIPLSPANPTAAATAAPQPAASGAAPQTFSYTTLTGVNVTCSGAPGQGEADDRFRAEQSQLTGIGGWIPTGAAAARLAGVNTTPGSCRSN